MNTNSQVLFPPRVEHACAPFWSLLTAVVVASRAALCSSGAVTEGDGYPGEVQFSDGETLQGMISLAPGAELRLHAEPRLRVFSLGEVNEIRIRVENETLERPWRFVEAGRTEKQYLGEPYPVRELRATVIFRSGAQLDGHLYTTSLYVQSGGGTRKIVLRSKLQGKPGETFHDLTFPTRIVLADRTAGPASGEISCRVVGQALSGQRELAILLKGSLTRFEARPVGDGGEFRLPSACEEQVFWALRNRREIVVGWPAEQDESLHAQIRKALGLAKDFFDTRQLLGVYADPQASDVYVLVLLQRSGYTTLGAARSQPWRLAIWRWKRTDDARLLLAGQGYFFRGILGKDEKPPPVRLSTALWNIPVRNGILIATDEL